MTTSLGTMEDLPQDYRDDMQAAINAVDGAIKALKESKGELSEAKLQLIQEAIVRTGCF